MAQITLIGEANHGHETQARDIQQIASASAPDALFVELDPNDPMVRPDSYEQRARNVEERGGYAGFEGRAGHSTKHQRLAHLCSVHEIESYFVDTGRTELLELAAEGHPHFPDEVQEIRDSISRMYASDQEEAKEYIEENPYLSDAIKLLQRDHRDLRMAQNIDNVVQSEGYRHGVAVMGDGHIEEVSNYLEGGEKNRLEVGNHSVACLRYDKQDDTIENEQGSWYIDMA